MARRAWDAHLNSHESPPAFAAAIIIAHLAHAPQHLADTLLVWVLARAAHVAFYLADKSTLRSLAHAASLICVVALFVASGLRGNTVP